MRKFSSLFGLIIGIVFCYGGVQIALETVIPTYQSWKQMQSWQSMSAELIDVRGSLDNIEASYRYTIASVDYRNNKVSVATYQDNLGNHQEQLAKKLLQLKAYQQPITI